MVRIIDSTPSRPSPVEEDKTVRFLYLFFGFMMIGHFILNIFICGQMRTFHDLLWLSHMGTLIGGVGALTRRPMLISVALVCLFEHHLFWFVDTVWWLISGEFPFGTTAYLKDAAVADWIKTSNHFFSVPFLLILAIIQGRVHKTAWIWSTALFATLAVVSAAWLPTSANVNCALAPCEGLDKMFCELFNICSFPLIWYFPLIIVFNGFLNYLPVNLGLSFIVPRIRSLARRFERRPE